MSVRSVCDALVMSPEGKALASSCTPSRLFHPGNREEQYVVHLASVTSIRRACNL